METKELLLRKDEEIYINKVRILELQESLLNRDKIFLEQFRNELDARWKDLKENDSSE